MDTQKIIGITLTLTGLILTPLLAIFILNLLPFVTLNYTILNWILVYIGIWTTEKTIQWITGVNLLDKITKKG